RWPTLSPDGRLLAFDALGKIWVCDLDAAGKAGAPRRLTRDTVREYAPEFSPDGKFIAYVTWSDTGMGHVWKIKSSGGTPVRLTRPSGHYVNPAWSPKGDRIAVVAGSGAELRGQQPEYDPYYEIRWLPSEPPAGGAWVAYVSQDDVHVAALPRVGKEPVEIGGEKSAVPAYRLSTEGGGYVGWANGGSTIVWGMGGTIYRQRLDKVREAILKKAGEATAGETKDGAGAGDEKAAEREMPQPE